MKVLIVDDQKVVQQIIIEIFKQIEEVEVVGVANNGEEALFKVKDLKPDLVFMDLIMPKINGIVATKKLVEQNPALKVIINTNHEENLFLEAIKAGAKGYIEKKPSRENYVAAIEAIAQNKIIYLKEDEVNLDQEKQKKVPTFSRLNSWSNMLAAEIIKCWIKKSNKKIPQLSDFWKWLGIEPKQERDWERIFFKGETDKCNLIQELELRVNSVKNQNNEPEKLVDKLEKVEKRIFRWYFDERGKEGYIPCLVRVQINSQRARLELNNKVSYFINTLYAEVPSGIGLKFLENLEEYLINIRRDYEKQKINYLKQEISAIRAYENLKFRLTNKEEHPGKIYQSAMRALLYSYTSKIKAELCSLIIQILISFKQRVQEHIDRLIKINCLLFRIRKKCLNEAKDNNLLPILFEQMLAITTPAELRKKIECKLGCELSYWGCYGEISEERIENLLLAEISIICQKIYHNIVNEFS